MNAYPLAALAAIAILIAAVAWWALDGLEPVRLPPPKYRGESVAMVEVHAPTLGDLNSEFNINAENPFIPVVLRDRERTEVNKPKVQQGKIAIKRSEPPKPPEPLVLPKVSARAAQAPEAIGLLREAGSERVNVIVPGSSSAAWMSVGDSNGDWTLKTIQDGNVAVFVDGTGRSHPVVISPGDLQAPTKAATAAHALAPPEAGPWPPGAGQLPPGATRPPGSGMTGMDPGQTKLPRPDPNMPKPLGR